MRLRVEVIPFSTPATDHQRVEQANRDRNIPLLASKTISAYLLKAEESQSEELQEAAKEVLCDPIQEALYFSDSLEEMHRKETSPPSFVARIRHKPGVTNTLARTTEEAFAILGHSCRVETEQLHLLYGSISQNQAQILAESLLGNALLHDIHIYSWTEFISRNRFADIQFSPVQLKEHQQLFSTFDSHETQERWRDWSTKHCWALSDAEILHLRQYFQTEDTQQKRQQKGLPKEPTDLEIEIIAQTWSEHCKHKIFNAEVEYREGELPTDQIRLGDLNISSLFERFIRAATTEIETDRNINWLRSVFHDNAGVVSFDAELDVAIKVETHNSPSALDPYGGAITGILGVNRDILGVGLAARPIANMNVFCLADPRWPLSGDEEKMPAGLKRPRQLLEGVHKGVQDGGNTSGIPTVNGAMLFDQDYAGKPLVFVGTVGVMPKILSDGRSGVEKSIRNGDLIYMVGGAIGADGIHGATFSSLALDEHAPATAVQLGDPLTQKRLLDFLLEARDDGLFSCITDNGAGGLSSSVGELALLSGGARLDLAKAPTKYPNLAPWQLMISESQERMTLSVPPEHCQALEILAEKHGVSATAIGMFTRSGSLDVYVHSQPVGSLDLQFLHDSLPPMQLSARWNGPIQRGSWIDRDDRVRAKQSSLIEKLHLLLSAPNIASKAHWVRQYDHEVQGATHVKPFGGSTQEGPNDAAVLWLYPHGGDQNGVICIGSGLQPYLSLYDPYLMAQYAVDEAVRNIVASGGDIDQTCLLDNFCWPDPVLSAKTPDGDLKMGQLVRACKGLYDIAKHYGTPIVSGKDSMKNDFRGYNLQGDPLQISILPTLLITALSRGSLQSTQTSGFTRAGDRIYWVGRRGKGLKCSEYSRHFFLTPEEDQLDTLDLAHNLRLYRAIQQALKLGLLSSLHDISDGGMLCALAESCFGEMLGARIHLPEISNSTCFSEGTGQFLLSAPPEKSDQLQVVFQGLEILPIGFVTARAKLHIADQPAVALSTLLESWTGAFS